MSRKNKTQQERQHLADIAALGCIACRMLGVQQLGEAPATPHHITTGKGMGEMRSDFETIPLCRRHHQGISPSDISVHGTPKHFRDTFGSELQLLEQTRRDLETLRKDRVGA